MSDRSVDPEELRDHANHLRALQDRFAAIRAASSHIAMSDDAYGQLCQMLPPIMESRHQDQDAGMEALAENLELLAEALGDCAADYEAADAEASDEFAQLESEL
ncbi:type VII secretion target [Glycomyces sp. NRRL B-16210]|uniref:type VII secretion target n=1 Tax=Glycomyces sp. NRRL B-16210 TaxID=1463821 RepID=UPI0004BE548F|nr:type VII secretion target [Glycomyces sp. NRRL B-16210]